RDKQQAITRGGKCRSTGDGKSRRDLSLTDSEDGLFVAMIQLNLPTVEVMLQQFFGGSFQIRAQQISRIAVIDVRMNRHFVRDRGDNDQSKSSLCSTASPEHVIENFVAKFAAFGTEVHWGLFPRQSSRLAHAFRSEDFDRIFATRIGQGWETESGVLPATRQQIDSGYGCFEDGTIAEAPVDWYQQLPLGGTLVIQ